MWEAFVNLMSNPMMQQALATGGQGLDPKGVGGALGGMVNQNLAAQNYQKWMKNLLAEGGQMKMDGKGMTLNVPTSALGQGGFGGLGIGEPGLYGGAKHTPSLADSIPAGDMTTIQPYGGASATQGAGQGSNLAMTMMRNFLTGGQGLGFRQAS